ncbi:spore coat polysaccharide biosynthesis protein SpsF [Alkalibacillus flavidus]|uniref:Spore coat polysaccharide biosynthesis protein SpsF n=1 Tax=Alkalibacillus flavidus TaxID=546021 RepID=A0ABV2KTS3_9BACI
MEKFHIREANESDCDQLFIWANDESVRQNAFDSNQINYSDHEHWFMTKLYSPNAKLFILTRHNKSIGQVRIDIHEHTGIVDYSIDKSYRGLGYGSQLIRTLETIIQQYDIPIDKIIGRVKYENLASIKAFEKAHFDAKRYDTYIEFQKAI